MSGASPAATSPATPPSLAPLVLQTRWACRPVVGRPAELNAIRQEIMSVKAGRLAALTFEGEPGIGKTRLLIAGGEAAAAAGFVTVAVTADEEIRGPFLLARAIFASAGSTAAPSAQADLQRALAAISGRDEPEMEGLSPDLKLLRALDLGAVAIGALAASGPVALLVDDLQWADDDSVRMLRYVVRTVADTPVLLMFSVRRDELQLSTEVGPLLADMERMGLVRRLQLSRLTPFESAALLQEALGSEVEQSSAVTMHAQAEGVPFILEELARTYREAGLVQEIDGVWTLAKSADRLVPSAVRTLIQRRAARVPEQTRPLLAEAAVLGRSFSLQDLRVVKQQLDHDDSTEAALAEALRPAVDAGLLVESAESEPADYRFTHEQVRQFAAAGLSVPRRRAIHRAVVDMLAGNGDPSPESLPLLAQHALAAGDEERASRFSITAAHAALAARAPEEVLRVVDLVLPAVSTAQDRVTLLIARDDALDMLHRPVDRLETLAELSALGEALGDARLELETMLRRSAALLGSEEEARAAALAAEVRELAEKRGDRHIELHACMQLGQALLRRPLGESFTPPAREADLDAAAEAFERAVDLATELSERSTLAAAIRELGVIDLGRVRAWYIELIRRGEHLPLVKRIAAGESLEAIAAEMPIADVHSRARERLLKAVELYEQLGDRRGFMSSVIALATTAFGLDIHLRGAARRIEEIRRLAIGLNSLSKASERARAEAQMLYGVHVFARAKGAADLAISRGEQAYEKARILADRTLEFAASGGVALAHLDLGEVAEADEWLQRASSCAAAEPTPTRARQLLLWRGTCSSVAKDAENARRLLQQAVQLATAQGKPAHRAEALARLSLELARLGEEAGDADLLALAEQAASEVGEMISLLPGHPLWRAQGTSALALVALARADLPAAAHLGREALEMLEVSRVEDLNLEIVLPAARSICEGGDHEERAAMRDRLGLTLALVAQRIFDEGVRVRWFRGPLGRELSRLVGRLDDVAHRSVGVQAPSVSLTADDVLLLRLVVEGNSNEEIARALAIPEAAVARRLSNFYGTIGTSSRAEAAAFAFREHAP